MFKSIPVLIWLALCLIGASTAIIIYSPQEDKREDDLTLNDVNRSNSFDITSTNVITLEASGYFAFTIFSPDGPLTATLTSPPFGVRTSDYFYIAPLQVSSGRYSISPDRFPQSSNVNIHFISDGLEVKIHHGGWTIVGNRVGLFVLGLIVFCIGLGPVFVFRYGFGLLELP